MHARKLDQDNIVEGVSNYESEHQNFQGKLWHVLETPCQAPIVYQMLLTLREIVTVIASICTNDNAW